MHGPAALLAKHGQGLTINQEGNVFFNLQKGGPAETGLGTTGLNAEDTFCLNVLYVSAEK